METSSTIDLTGYVGLIVFVAGAVFQLVKFTIERRRERRRDQREDRHERGVDAASMLTGQQAALDGERAENTRLRLIVAQLDMKVDELRREMTERDRRHEAERDEMRDRYERELEQMRSELVTVLGRLDELQRSLHPEGNA